MIELFAGIVFVVFFPLAVFMAIRAVRRLF